MSDQKLSIQIETTATGQGVQQTAAGLEQLSGAAQKAAPAVGALGNQSKATAQELGRGVEVGNAAVSAFQNIANAGQGGASGLIAVARAGFSAGAMFKGLLASMGPVGIAAAAIGIALGLVSAALRKSEAAAAEAKKKIDELNKAKLDDAVKQQEALKRAAEDTLRTLQAEAAAREQIGEAELGRRKAETIAAGKAAGEDPITTQQKLTALDRQWEDEKRTNALKLANDEAALRAKAQRDLEAAQKKAQQEIADAEARRAAVVAAKQKLAATKPESTSGSYGMSLNGDPARQKALADLEAAREAAKMDTDDRLKDLKSDAEKKKVDAEAAARSAAQARAAADLLANTKRATDPLIAATRSAEDRAKAPQSDAEKAAIEKAKAKQDEQIRRTPAAIWNNRIASGDTSVDMDALRRNYPAYKFATPAAAPTAPLTPTSIAAAQPGVPAPAPGGGTIQRGGETFRAGAGGLEKVADALKGTTEATQEADTGDATAKAAEALQQATEQTTQAQRESGEATAAALGDATAAQQQAAGEVLAAQRDTVAKLGQIAAAQNSLRSEVASLRSQIRAMRVA